VPGYEGLYEASSFGRVRRPPDWVPLGGGFGKPGRILSKSVHAKGYFYVNTRSRRGKKSSVTVHSLVAGAFLGPRPEGMVVNHRDGNKLNNKPSNLEWVTQKENDAHARRMGLTKTARGEGCDRDWETRL